MPSGQAESQLTRRLYGCHAASEFHLREMRDHTMPSATKEEMIQDRRDRLEIPVSLLYVLLALPILALGAIEGWYKRTFYTTDAISYLDISRAIPRHEWKLVFNPLWSSGYPFLIAIMRAFFPRDARGDWAAIHVVNLAILLFAYGTFLWLLRSFRPDLPAGADNHERFLLLAGVCIFLCTELCINGVSRVSPDPLVDGLFFAAMGASLRLLRKPSSAGLAILLGAILGVGYLAKAIFLPASAIILVVTAIALKVKKQKAVSLLLSAAVFALFAIPYAVELSHSVGRFTLGDAGTLNYAFHVNLLPRYTNWQGGPEGYGTPIHPTRLLMKNPNFYEFGEPYHNTYPPFGNAVYWYEGYRHFWSPKYQAAAMVRNTYYLASVLLHQPVSYAIAGAIIALFFLLRERREWGARTLTYRPFSLPPLLLIGSYIFVHLEDRYIASFLAVLGLLPFVSLCASQRKIAGNVRSLILAMLVSATALSFVTADRVAFVRALHHRSYLEDSEWTQAAYLRQTGLVPGDKVGAIGGPNAECTWAYVDGLRIVAELGGAPYDAHPVGPHSHWWANGTGSPDSSPQMFWNSSPEAQAKILNLFEQAGAVAILAPAKSPDASVPGWERIPDSTVWVHRFPERADRLTAAFSSGSAASERAKVQ
jgi:hypothetical protein